MTYRFQLSPVSGTHESQGLPSLRCASFPEVHFSSDLRYADFEGESVECDSYNPALGFGLAILFSLSFWAGLGLLVRHIW